VFARSKIYQASPRNGRGFLLCAASGESLQSRHLTSTGTRPVKPVYSGEDFPQRRKRMLRV